MPWRCVCFDRRLRPGRVPFTVAATLARPHAVTDLRHAEGLDPPGSCICREKVAMRPARIIAAVLFAAAIAITGCTAHTSVDQPSPPPPAPNPTHAPRPPTPPTDPTPPDRQAPIYATVLRQYLTSGHGHQSGDAGFGGHRFPRIFVLDRAVAGTGAPGWAAPGGGPIPAADQRALVQVPGRFGCRAGEQRGYPRFGWDGEGPPAVSPGALCWRRCSCSASNSGMVSWWTGRLRGWLRSPPAGCRDGPGCAWAWPPRPWAPGPAARRPRRWPGPHQPGRGRAG
jgi:hypothetical protein